MQLKRSSGILLHISSLPGKYGVGSMGFEAFQWVDFLSETGTKYWQILPLNPAGSGNSPYQGLSAFAGNPFFIDPEGLLEMGLLNKDDLPRSNYFPIQKVDFKKMAYWKTRLFTRAFNHFLSEDQSPIKQDFEYFKEENKYWLKDFAMFMEIFEQQNRISWNLWPEPLKMRDPKALHAFTKDNSEQVEFHCFLQFIFALQLRNLKSYATEKKIQLFGDIPIFMGYDSADVWANPHLFQLDQNRERTAVAGVPPDFFSATGQLWGNPLYDWEMHKKEKYRWWINRIQAVLKTVDLARMDHFRGFASYFSIPVGAETAQDGQWMPGPGAHFFDALKRKLGRLPFAAEDLGVITPDVTALRDRYQFPGMRLIQIAFSGDASHEFLPHNYPVNCIAYTGTHDNDTTVGWYKKAPTHEKRFCSRYLGCGGRGIVHEMIRTIWRSNALVAIAPMQDFLRLGSHARMNTPATPEGNWQWRMKPDAITPKLKRWIREMNTTFGRSA